MKLHHLRPAPGAHRKRQRVGRGEAGRRGKTAGRGTKGTGARGSVKAWFEGGQMPLQRRLPKLGGFTPLNRTEYATVNLDKLGEAFASGETVSPEALRSKGLVRKQRLPVKVLGRGDVAVPLTVRAHAFSASAAAKIEAAGGSVEVI